MNVLFHLLNTLLVFLVFLRMTGAFWRCAVLAGLFALHPLQVDTVAWVAERKNLLSTLFGLLAIWAYARYAGKSGVQSLKSKVQGPKSVVRGLSSILPSPPASFYLLSLLMFALSLMCKPALVTLPFVLLLLDYWPLRRFQIRLQDSRLKILFSFLLEKLPFLLLAAASSMITILAHRGLGLLEVSSMPPMGFRLQNAFVSYARYLGKALWPSKLAVFYPLPAAWPLWIVALSGLLLLSVSALAIATARNRPYLFVGWFWFAGVLVPCIGLVQAGAQALADRFAYLPLVGVFIMAAWTGAECLDALRLSAKPRIVGTVLMLGLCAALTRHQLQFWLNTETIFTHAIAVTQDNWLAHYNLALLALRRYQNTQRGPVEKQVLTLGNAPRSSSESGPAPHDYLSEIIFHCQATLRSKPGFPDPRVTLAKALTEQGRLDEARAQLELAIPLDPGSSEARQNLAEILQRQGRIADAITEYKAALMLRPDWEQVLNNLAWLLATHPNPEVRNGVEAVGFAERACALTSHTNLWFLHTLAAAYAERGDFPQAVATAAEARRLAAASGRPELVNLAETRLGLYKARQPLRAP